tara:strand:- start:2019 stop:2369 length:351 start_codon:yes stop_codon:yes gene_type:complete
MDNLEKLIFDEAINLNKSSEIKYKSGNFRGAFEDKSKAKSIIKKIINSKEIKDKFKDELSILYNSKFDLIYDHKRKINEFKRAEIIKLLEDKSKKKLQEGDFKGAIKALRRSEKYL